MFAIRRNYNTVSGTSVEGVGLAPPLPRATYKSLSNTTESFRTVQFKQAMQRLSIIDTAH